MVELGFVPKKEFDRVMSSELSEFDKLRVIADMFRLNALCAVKLAGSGHLGSTLSSLDIITYLYLREMNTLEKGLDDPDRDIFFSSKGHDVPGLYALLDGLGVLEREKLKKLRRFGGLCGHPDVGTRGLEASSGSLGMGISKGKGMAAAKRLAGRTGRVFVMTGDGELQEGQIYEALQTCAHQGIENLYVIVDHNKVQSDQYVSTITDLGALEPKFKAFGWHVARVDGHDFAAMTKVFDELRNIPYVPKVVIADTVKGRGISFMESTQAMKHDQDIYTWHVGAPNDEKFLAGQTEIVDRINACLGSAGLEALSLEYEVLDKSAGLVSPEYLADAYGRALVELGAKHDNLVVLDADLAADCRVRAFGKQFPDRFVENGIAEQDMVSMAGGMALQGFLPVVNSFAAFLASRSNEQIYNNSCEKTKIIYAMHYSGLIPAGPGLSHQSVRDISLLRSIPDVLIVQPCCGEETRLALRYFVEKAENTCVLRLNIGPSPRTIELPKEYEFAAGRGCTLAAGEHASLVTYGPVMAHEALLAAEMLEKRSISLRVINMPWLNTVDATWLNGALDGTDRLYVLEDHSPEGGLGHTILRTIGADPKVNHRYVRIFGVKGFPAWGDPGEALRHHGLNGASLARRIEDDLNG
jgi:transketolase